MHKDGEIEEDVGLGTKAMWMQCRSILGLLFDHRISLKLNGNSMRLLEDQLCFMIQNVEFSRSNVL